MDEILAAVHAVNDDYAGHCRHAREIGREWFDYARVLPLMLSELGV
jgi:hypothetical protein